jgi:ABC-type uncharacterized transport system permease subunit
MNLLVWITAALYGVATAFYLVHAARRNDGLARLARLVLFTAFISHVGAIGSFCLRGTHPVSDTSGILGLIGWLLVGGFLLTSLRYGVHRFGSIIAAAAVALLLFARHLLSFGQPPKGSAEALGRLHLTMVAVGIAIFGLAAFISLIYLVQESALKNKKLLLARRNRTPPLDTLDRISRILIVVGFPIYSVAVLTGFAWMSHFPQLGFRVEYAISAGIWVIFGGLIVSRSTVGLRGRRAAWSTLAGFVGTAVVLAIYAARRMLGP